MGETHSWGDLLFLDVLPFFLSGYSFLGLDICILFRFLSLFLYRGFV